MFAAEASEHLPASEAGVRDLLSAALRTALELDRAEVVVEARVGRKLLDIWVPSLRLAIEVKYHRRIPSGWNRPMTQQFGDLLADVRKLAAYSEAQARLLVLVADEPGVTHVQNKGLLPIRDPSRRSIRAADVEGLASTARRRVAAEGPWLDVSLRRVWHDRLAGGLQGFAWEIAPGPG